MTISDPTSPTPKPAPAHEAAQRRDWPAYFDRMVGKPARDTLLAAIEAFGEIDPADPPLAADLGCGAGRDVVELLESGWRVWAQDASSDGLDRLRAHPICARAIKDGRLEVVLADFADTRPPRAALVNASFSLPFCPPSGFDALWALIYGAVEPGGRFSGQFFGDRDDWAILEDRTHLTRAQVLGLFSKSILESFREEDRPSAHAGEAHKHWHVFHVVARKG
ncbi:MAG: SAM-dependent methyltransferase [Phycisphaeraceae bacterium]|nr:MAG: SAM-dependent methyltransferase [Phycisphaeraceae bacterium]